MATKAINLQRHQRSRGSIAGEALYAAERAVALDPSYTPRLVDLASASGTGDLASLADNPRLKAILA